jgi:uncharacterized tellurite resistance protein B-like protein
MSFTDFITDSGKKICIEHYIHLVQVSRIDGSISDQEMRMLHREGRKFGLTDPEVDKIIKSESNHQYIPPYSLKGKFDQIYNVAQIILADEQVTEAESKMIKRFAIEAGFRDEVIPKIIDLLMEGIKKGDDEDDLFERFRKEVLA